MMHRLKRYLITGLIVVVPVGLTIYVLVAVFNFVDNILRGYVTPYLNQWLGYYIPGIGFMLFFCIIMLVGFLATRFIGKKIFPYFERLFSSLPLISKIYPAFKQIIMFVFSQKEFAFKKVVLVEYPSKGIWSIGFLTNEQFKSINQATGRDMVSVFMPNTPGPISGYVVFFPKEEVKFLDIPVGDALKILISGGSFRPN